MNADSAEVGPQRPADFGTDATIQGLAASACRINLVLEATLHRATFQPHSGLALNVLRLCALNQMLHSPVAIATLELENLSRRSRQRIGQSALKRERSERRRAAGLGCRLLS